MYCNGSLYTVLCLENPAYPGLSERFNELCVHAVLGHILLWNSFLVLNALSKAKLLSQI